MSLSPTAKTNICIVLEALVNAGGVRPEDDTAVTTALSDLKTELLADEADIADLKTRVGALEDLENGVETALETKPASAADPGAATGAAADASAGTAADASAATGATA